MYDLEGTSIAFDYAEPPRTVSGIGRFIRTRRYFVTDNFDEFIVETRWDGDVSVDPCVEVGDPSLSKNAVYVVTALWLCA
jgi:hypothetical protein